jgi:hypothetical protein
MSLLVTLLLDRERAHNLINRKSEFIKNMSTSSVFNDLVSSYDLYGKYDTIDGQKWLYEPFQHCVILFYF